ncbi:DUF1622 domain-containing protein [Laspinema sp. D2d]|uniref:DUF1622 domain-containing protein n=1 Tax=Laspinema sp. D2d TaxID=2953686 RepID=UPI0021BB400D|nr:DUF1622 domain-containing protein [Laspinema sp. D2d]
MQVGLPSLLLSCHWLSLNSSSLGLSFLIGATILKTMISSQWDDIARLVAIIAVRTVLNYLLLQAIAKATPEVSQVSSPAQA